MYKKLLVAVSLADETGPKVIKTAKSLLADGGSMEVLYVLDDRYVQFVFDPSLRGNATDELTVDAIEKSREKLTQLCAEQGLSGAKKSVLFGHPATAIQEAARNADCDLIVMGTHGRRGWRRVLGSVAGEVLHGTPTNVLLCRSAVEGHSSIEG